MIEAYLYYPIFLYSVTAIGFIMGFRYISSPDYAIQEKGAPDFILPFLICIIYAMFLGGRPVSFVFGDTINYAREYLDMIPGEVHMDWHSEWVWQLFMASCKSSGLSLEWFFTLVDLVYFLSALFAIKQFTPNNIMLGMMFVLSSLMFFTFGVNGIRNGVACHILLLAMALLFNDKYVAGCVTGAIAFGIHRSTALPIAACLVALFVLKDVKYAIFFWLACIPVSLVAGGMFIAFFGALGFDDRMTQYATLDASEGFSKTGFRWDFLLYSSMPVIMAWWVCIKKQISDNWYNTLCIIYCLCNAFWILVIRANFSNRFAYLSWFMYPIVIAYPLIMLPVWDDQDQKIGLILYAYMAFTLVMNFLWGQL